MTMTLEERAVIEAAVAWANLRKGDDPDKKVLLNSNLVHAVAALHAAREEKKGG